MKRTIGIILSILVTAALAADASVNLFAPGLLKNEMLDVQFPVSLASTIGLIILVCAVLYAVPATSFVGAIMITGFLGGAICTHLRLGEIFSPPQFVSLLLGVAAWGGLFLRDERVRIAVTGRLPSTAH
jgi:hypothetical protein